MSFPGFTTLVYYYRPQKNLLWRILSTVGADNSEKVYFMIAARDEEKTFSKKSHFKVTGFFLFIIIGAVISTDTDIWSSHSATYNHGSQ